MRKIPEPDNLTPSGTRATHYAPARMGPFRCDHCRFFERPESVCRERHVMADPDMPRDNLGRPIVEPGGCCEYQERSHSGRRLKVVG